MSSLLKRLELILTLPSKVSSDTNQIVYEPVPDCIVLSCGNLISDKLFMELSKLTDCEEIACPVCFKQHVKKLNVVPQMRDLYLEYQRLLTHSVESISDTLDGQNLKMHTNNSVPMSKRRTSGSKKSASRRDSNGSNVPKMSLLTAFHEVVSDLNKAEAMKSLHSTSPKSMGVKPSTSQPAQDFRAAHINIAESPQDSNLGDWIATMNDSTTLKSFSSSKSNNTELNSTRNTMGKQAPNTSSTHVSNLTNAIRTKTNILTSSAGNKLKDTSDDTVTDKELLYARNFPFFRKQIQHSTRSSKFFLKGKYSKLFINTDISPDLRKYVLLSERKFEVYTINPDTPTVPPTLLCCGKSTGEYGSNLDSMIKPSLTSLVSNSNKNNAPNDANVQTMDEIIMDKLMNWEHLYCKLSENFLVVAGTRGILRIYNLNQNGKPIYTHYSKFPIRCIDISADEQFVSIGITGQDRYTQTEQALIVLLKLEFLNLQQDIVKQTLYETNSNDSSESAATADYQLKPQSTSDDFKFKVEVITVTLPYRDPINNLKFSPNSQYLSCSTALESRFVVISIENPDEPKLVMKSLRSLDTSLESEGITDLVFFPDNQCMTITSVAYNGVPIVIDTRITSIKSIQGMAQPLMMMRVDEVGSAIHKAAVSPRGDAIAFLDRNGSVYLMSSPHMDDNENKRIVVVAEVANSYRAREAATLKFDRDGYKLYILDRKGVLYIEDFTAGTSQGNDITRCKLIC